jgi:hypothetical protein
MGLVVLTLVDMSTSFLSALVTFWPFFVFLGFPIMRTPFMPVDLSLRQGRQEGRLVSSPIAGR